MKQYWEIPGPNKAPRLPCIAFKKYDGSLIRSEWSKKSGWNKFGSRHVLIDITHHLGKAIKIFQDKYAKDIEKIIKKNKIFRGVQSVTTYCEYVGPNSFAGIHDPNDEMDLILFDVNMHKKGLMSPREFLKAFKGIDIAEIVYEGNFNVQFIKDIKDGKYNVDEGVVAKGVKPGKKSPHGLWMAKVKTKEWMEKLKHRAEYDESLKGELLDNINEQ